MTNWAKIRLLEARMRYWRAKYNYRHKKLREYGAKVENNRRHFPNHHQALKEAEAGVKKWGPLEGQAAREVHRYEEAIAKLKPKPKPKPSGSAQAIVAAARRACAEVREYEYREIRPYPHSLFGPTPRRMDCSGFSILCYKAGGAPDPNGSGYDGYGNTYTLANHGWRVSGPEPGALAFYYNLGHVAVCLGGDLCANMGKPGEPVIERLWPGVDEYRMYEV